MTFWKILLAGAAVAGAARAQAAITLNFDYTYDVNGFFANPAAKATLEEAGRLFSDRFMDTLAPIVPSGSNTWSAVFTNPGTGAEQQIGNMTVPADTLRIFPGARNLGGSTLGMGGPGAFNASGSTAWGNLVRRRGETPGSDIGPWGGAITFDSDTDWNLSLASGPAQGQSDFYSVAVHELGHLLGFGVTESYVNLRNGNTFTGAKSVAVHGGPVPLSPDLAHWAAGTGSFVGDTAQEANLSPSILRGTRKRFTTLDFAGIDDIGWELPTPGDLDLNGRIDIDDYWRIDTGFLERLTGYRNGDLDADGVIDLDDYAIIDANFLAQSGAASPAVAAVPEPSALGAAGVAGCLGLTRRRRGGRRADA